MDNQTALTVNGEEISTNELLRGFKRRRGSQWLEEAIEETLLQQAARGKVELSDEELQLAADEFRRHSGLFEVDATEEWLKQNGLTLDEFEENIVSQLTRHRLREQITQDQVEPFFASNKAAFDHAVISQIRVDDEGLGAELSAQVSEEGADFAALAREHSVDKATGATGGLVGPVGRGALGAEAEALVFGASPGDVVGPIRGEQGWLLLKVHAVMPAEMNAQVREQIKDILFGQWLQEQRTAAAVTTPVLTAV